MENILLILYNRAMGNLSKDNKIRYQDRIDRYISEMQILDRQISFVKNLPDVKVGITTSSEKTRIMRLGFSLALICVLFGALIWALGTNFIDSYGKDYLTWVSKSATGFSANVLHPLKDRNNNESASLVGAMAGLFKNLKYILSP